METQTEEAKLREELEYARVQIERTKVLMESLAGFCHSLGQPATVILNSLELLKMPETDDATRTAVVDICYDAAMEIRRLLAEMKERREYASAAYRPNDATASDGNIVKLPDWKK